MSKPGQKLYLIDGTAFCYRAYYAIRALSNSKGEPTNAIYGFIKMLGKLRALLEPARMVIVWDGGLAAERLAALPDYKAQRAPMPPALEPQLDEIGEYLQAAGIASCCYQGVEADDWIATLARHAVEADMTVVIASSDKDFMQLVSSHVGLFNPNDKSETVWGAEQVLAKAGVQPGQIVDWLSLVGDAVDNIPGVPGVGTKTAAELLRQFGSVEELFKRLHEVRSEKLRVALQSAREIVQRNQHLIRLNDGLPGPGGLDDYSFQTPNRDQLCVLYARWGFKSMLAELGPVLACQRELF